MVFPRRAMCRNAFSIAPTGVVLVVLTFLTSTLQPVGLSTAAAGETGLCRCDVWLGLRRARCAARRLYSVEVGAPSDTQALDLASNSISAIGNREIADAGLKSLKYLNLSDNVISEIALDAFAGLDSLIVLDLSRNHLNYLLEEVFLKTENLRVLRLSGNNFNMHVPKLHSLSITDLSLDSCQIDHLPVDTFAKMSNLRNLDLSGNAMIELNVLVLENLENLGKISLDGNPWSCDGGLRKLTSFLTARDVKFREICSDPSGPEKSQKMILAPVTARKPKKKLQARIFNTTSVPNLREKPSTVPETDQEDVELKFPRDFPGKWIFVGGLTLGIFIGATCNCVCWSIFLHCRKKRGEARNDPQRSSLLATSWTDDLRQWENCRPEPTCRREIRAGNGREQRRNRATRSNRYDRLNVRRPAFFRSRLSRSSNRPATSAENSRQNEPDVLVNLPDDSVENRGPLGFFCPGTPPPAYREVMSRPALYRSPTTPSNGHTNSP